MKTEKYTHLRAQVQKIEERILAITGKNVEFNMEWTRSQRKREQVERLIWKRKHLLDRMFIATSEEVVRMEQVNNRLYDLTQKMYARTEALYRKMATTTYDPEFDDDVEVKVSHQHWEEQDGSGGKWWERCSFEEFRGKFVRK